MRIRVRAYLGPTFPVAYVDYFDRLLTMCFEQSGGRSVFLMLAYVYPTYCQLTWVSRHPYQTDYTGGTATVPYP